MRNLPLSVVSVLQGLISHMACKWVRLLLRQQKHGPCHVHSPKASCRRAPEVQIPWIAVEARKLEHVYYPPYKGLFEGTPTSISQLDGVYCTFSGMLFGHGGGSGLLQETASLSKTCPMDPRPEGLAHARGP